MISNDKKHIQDKLTKPSLGEFGRNEFALYGTTCEDVAEICRALREALPQFDIAFADADHQDSYNEHSSFQEKQNAFSCITPFSSNIHSRRNALSQADLVLVNGNHFKAKNQIIICNEKKESSLRKRAAELTNVIAIVLENASQITPEYVKELVPHCHALPVFSKDTFSDFAKWVLEKMLPVPQISALILAGGESRRMGRDKTIMQHHDEPQVVHLARMVSQLGMDVYISCRTDQKEQFEDYGLQTNTDRITGIGPMSGIISAFMSKPDHAHLVIASDIPLIDREVLQTLVQYRDPSKIATAFKSATDGLPEPLITIWEPKSYPLILSFIGQGISCPRKVLINCPAHLIDHPQAEKLINVNTTEDLQNIRERIKTKN